MLILIIILSLLAWVSAGFLTIYWIAMVHDYEINGPIQTIAILVLWPFYLINLLRR